MSELAKQCARLDGACVHAWLKTQDTDKHDEPQYFWKCSRCVDKSTCGSKALPQNVVDLPYTTCLNTAVKFARRMGVSNVIITLSTGEVVVKCRRLRYDRFVSNTRVESYQKHQGNEIVAAATAICGAVVAVKEG